jgi:hypothetical protein
MGVTIHFEGSLHSATALHESLEVARHFAKANGWQVEVIDSPTATLRRVRDEEDWDYVGPVKGLALFPGPDCDPVRLEFDRELYVQEFTKTQFAGLDTHVKVVELLRALEPFFAELKVEDEGEFWETRDREGLKGHVEACNRALRDYLADHPSAQPKVRLEDGRIVDFLS